MRLRGSIAPWSFRCRKAPLTKQPAVRSVSCMHDEHMLARNSAVVHNVDEGIDRLEHGLLVENAKFEVSELRLHHRNLSELPVRPAVVFTWLVRERAAATESEECSQYANPPQFSPASDS